MLTQPAIALSGVLDQFKLKETPGKELHHRCSDVKKKIKTFFSFEFLY
jgi:hypothetical protein